MPRQHEASGAASRQHAERGACLLGGEQEILHVADHMLGLCADDDGFAASVTYRLRHRCARIEALAMLIEPRHGEIGAETHAAGIRRQRAGQ